MLTLYAPSLQNGQTQSNNSSAVDRFVGLALKGLKYFAKRLNGNTNRKNSLRFHHSEKGYCIIVISGNQAGSLQPQLFDLNTCEDLS